MLDPSSLPEVTRVDPRFQSFNVEMVEVTGGRFWAPYALGPDDGDESPLATPALAGDGDALRESMRQMFRYRPPLDVGNARLRLLAGALAPAYMRVSGAWANSTYFHDSHEPYSDAPPEGFGSVLTREQWRGVVQMSQDLGLDILLSFAICDGVRDANGVWQTDQARALFAATSHMGGRIAAVEFMNETSMGHLQGLSRSYGPADYARDFAAFKSLVEEVSPQTLIAGPSAVSERTGPPDPQMAGLLRTQDIYELTGPMVDAFSYHYYGGVSKRCTELMKQPTPQASRALTAEWLAGTGLDADFYGDLRDRVEPGKPLWLTETAEAACGGNPWASTFLDTFRYVDQLGELARRSVQTVMHNTLAASDYALLDEDSFEPRPSYWAAWLWRRLMGDVVLDPGKSPAPSVRIYAHSLRGVAGGVAVVALNTDVDREETLELVGAEQRFTLHVEGPLETQTVLLNGSPLALTARDELPALAGTEVASGRVELPPASISFLTLPNAAHPAC